MANWFTRMFRRPAEVERFDVSQLLAQANDPYAVLLPSSWSTSRYGQPVEGIESSFDGYVQRAYKGNGVIFAVVLARMLLFTEARFRWRQVRFGQTGDLFGTAELGVLEGPWPNGTTGELLARMEQDVSLGGNFYCVREGDRLRRLRPDWVEIVLSAPPDEAVQSDVIGYLYTPGGPGRSEPEVYLPEEMCHWSPIPDPTAQYRGMSWLTPVISEIEADAAATRHKTAFFRNGAKPGLVVSMKETVTEEQFGRFVEKMNAAHVGADQAYKTLYVGGGADVTVAGADLRQLDFKNTQGAGETRICAAGGVPPIIVGLSEGLQSATYSNYASARRKFGDHWARPQWRSACAALAGLLDVPDRAELWYDDRDIAFLREDQKDQAEILKERILAIEAGVRAGFKPDSLVRAVTSGDLTLMEHTGLYSVQLQPPGKVAPMPGAPVDAGPPTAAVDAARAGNADELRKYWTRGPGLAKWADSPHPWTALYHHLLKYLPEERAKRTAAEWFHQVKGYWPGHQAGDNPVGPG